MRVFLVVPPVLFARQAPIATAYLAAYLKHKGHEVQARDLNTEISISNDSDERFWSDYSNCSDFFTSHKNLFETWVEEILNFSPNVVGFSLWESTEYFAIEMAKMLKKMNKEILIVFGGFWCAINGKRLILNDAVDVVVYGEGELTLADIVENYGRIRDIQGCLIKYNGEIKTAGSRMEIGHLDKLPFPDLSFFPLDKYLFKYSAPISFSRGCDWRCSFCVTGCQWKRLRVRKAENIYNEIMHRLEELPKLRSFQICDPSITSDINNLSDLCDLIIKSNVKADFSGFAQIKPGVTQGLLKKLKEAGFPSLGYGIESGSKRILNKMIRPYTPELAERVIKDTYYAGIEVVLGFIVGFPGETEEDFQDTLNFIKRVKDYVKLISCANECTIIPGTYLDNYPQQFGIICNGNSWETNETSSKRRKERVDIFNDLVKGMGILNIPQKDRQSYSEKFKEMCMD